VIAYVDASVLLRVVLRQRNRLREWRAIREGVASALVQVECLRTLDRLRLAGRLSDADLAVRREAVFWLMGEMTVVEVSGPVLDRASQALPSPLGTLDAIHLATALSWKERAAGDLVVATHDSQLGLAARGCGLAVVGL
jgi:predicted nucleic acid-binding protein